jgi:hypothetical protein
MKNKIITILTLLIFGLLNGFSQSVPNTTTFSLQDVVDVVNPTTDDLSDCFSDAVSGYFDPTYSGSKDRLSNFRNYTIANDPPYILAMNKQQSTGSSPTTAVFPGTTTISGDLAIITMAANPAFTESFSTPSGWAALGSDKSNVDVTYRFFSKVLSGGEQGSSVTITTSVPDITARLAVITVIRDRTSSGSFSSTTPVASTGTSSGEGAAASNILCKWSIFGYNFLAPTFVGNTMDLEGNFAVTGGNGCRIVLHSTTGASVNYSWAAAASLGYATAEQSFEN